MNPARSIALALLFGSAILVNPGGAQAEQEDARSVRAHRPADARGNVIVPDTFLRRWDPVTIFFARNTGPSEGGPEDRPERFVSFSPAHPGAFQWLDARTLQFRPADPWPPLTRFVWEAGRHQESMVTLMSAPIGTLPQDGAEDLGPVDEMALTFADPVDVEALKAMVTIDVAPLPALSSQAAARWLSGDDLEVKVLERRSRDEPARYILRLLDPIPLGHKATLHLRLSLDPKVEAPNAESFSKITFATAEPFRALRMGCRGSKAPLTVAGSRYDAGQALRCAAAERSVRIEFSASLKEVDPVLARNLVRFSPRVEDLGFEIRGRSLEINGRFEAGTLYKMTLVPTPLSDASGRPLRIDGESELFLTFPSLPTFIRWAASQGVLERKGPKEVPIEGRGAPRVDLRIHRIDPLDRSLWPFPDKPVTVDESERPPGPGEEIEAHTSAARYPTSSELASRIAALGTPSVSRIINLPIGPDRGAASFGIDLGAALAEIDGDEAPGTYLVGLRRLDRGSSRQWMRVQVTDLSLTTLESHGQIRFVVTSLSTGRPVRGATVEVQGLRSGWQTLERGRTANDGSYTWLAPTRSYLTRVQVRRIVVTKGDDRLVLDPTRPPERFGSGHWHSDRSTWLQGTLHSRRSDSDFAELLAHVFTERPVYRPEEKVHIQGYVRRREAGRFQMESLDRPIIEIEGPGGLRWRYPVSPTEGGSFHHAFDEKDIPTGSYLARLRDSRRTYGQVSFRVESYRLPSFEVALHGPDEAPSDRPFEVGLSARYYAGGQVATRPLRWRITQFPLAWTPRALPGFRFSSDDRFSGNGRFDSSPRLDSRAETDAEGGANIAIDPTVEPCARPRTYVVEATVTGADDQTVTAVKRVRSLPPFAVGVKVPRVVRSDSTIAPEIVVAGHDGELLAGKEVSVTLRHRQWHSHLAASDFSDGEPRYITEMVDEDVLEITVESLDEPLGVELPIERAGVYVVEVSAKDRLGRAQVVAVDLFASGEEPVSWQRPEAGVFEVSTDKEEYDPGKTATLVLKSPFQRGYALAVIEGPARNTYEWLTVRGGTATLRVPIETAYAPRLPVHFVLMRGRVDGSGPTPGTSLDLGKPHTLASTTWLSVSPRDHRISVSIEHPERALPGEEIEIEVGLADHAGRPLEGEVALWLVDRAVLALGSEQRLDPLPDFLKPATSRLSVRDTRALAFGRLPLRENPGGGGGSEELESDLLDRATIRRRFAPVPFHDPAVQVDESGRAIVKIRLPDNLTDFAVRAKAVSGPGRFGHGAGEISVRLPLIVQPALPRFVRPGDAFIAAAVGRVVEGPGGEGKVEMRAEGLKLEGSSSRDVIWPDSGPRRFEVPVNVPMPKYDLRGDLERDEVFISFGVERRADGASDAFEVALPIRKDRLPVHRRVLEVLGPEETLELPDVEEEVREGTLRRSVLVSGEKALVTMALGLDMLRRHPHEGTESRVARARVDLATRQLREVLHRPEDSEKLAQTVHDTLLWLPTVVDGHGLVSHWPGGRGSVILTSWVVHFLAEAEDAGFSVDSTLVDRLVHSLTRALRSDYGRFIHGEAFTERTFALSALARVGRLNTAYATELARNVGYLDLEAVAQVILALDSGNEAGRARPLARRLWAGTEIRSYRGKERFGGFQPARRHRSPRILPSETRTLAEMVRALGRVDPAHPRLPVLVDGLVTLGRGDGWGSTNADAAAMLALAERLEGRGIGDASYHLTVTLAGRSETIELGPNRPVGVLVGTEAGRSEISSSADEAAVAVLAETSYVPLADGSQVAPESRGFVVSRSLHSVRKEEDAPPSRTPLTEAGQTVSHLLGEVVEEHVRVVSPESRHYVAISVPLAAGLEPLNPNLATASMEARPSREMTREPTYTAYLDDKVVFYFESLPRGTYDFYFRTRASTKGSFIQPAARAEMIYDRGVYGGSAGARVVVTGLEEQR